MPHSGVENWQMQPFSGKLVGKKSNTFPSRSLSTIEAEPGKLVIFPPPKSVILLFIEPALPVFVMILLGCLDLTEY